MAADIDEGKITKLTRINVLLEFDHGLHIAVIVVDHEGQAGNVGNRLQFPCLRQIIGECSLAQHMVSRKQGFLAML